ncbi:MAG: 4-hydroxy-tetrahydrodipicolinate synthase [Cyclobacteriaceae bacterium]|nr:4-hydroxy-tetrahydrodipicolinate synthase [Cyclobacteriaceae bacterium]
MKKLHGTGVALVTPFDDQGDIDYTALKRLLRHTAKGVDYYVVLGTTGESATLSKHEKQGILDFVRNHNTARLPIVYGIGGNNTAAVIEELMDTDLTGVDALLSVSPYYIKPSQAGIIQHYETIATVSPVPLLLYNIPGRTASNLTADTILTLADNPRIIGVKDSSGNIEQCMRVARQMPKDFLLLSGDDMLTSTIYAMGGSGVISVLANAFPVAFRRITTAAREGQLVKSSRYLMQFLEINGLMYEEGNPVGLKCLLGHMGLMRDNVRLPHAPASRNLSERIVRSWEEIKKG